MVRRARTPVIHTILLAGILSLAAEQVPERKAAPARIDFDDRLIQGQSNTTGAVYLLERKETAIRSMVRPRISFRHLTIRTVYDR